MKSPNYSRRAFLHHTMVGSLAMGAAGNGNLWADEKVPTDDEYLRGLADKATLAMQFQGTTKEECKAWQQAFGSKLDSLLGPHNPPKEFTVEVEAVVEREDHKRHEWIVRAEGMPPLPVYLLEPKGAKAGATPGVLALHGHGSFGYDPIVGKTETAGVEKAIESANYDYGLQLVRRGYAVAVPCFMPFGRRLGNKGKSTSDPCGLAFIRLQAFGKVLMGENLRDARLALECLLRLPCVDAQRLGCVGLSYGGRMTMLTTAREPRIKVAVISGALNVMQERLRGRYSCGAQIIPGLLNIGDVPEIASLIAPRPCLWEVGNRDGLIDPDWASAALTRIGRAYAALSSSDQLRVDRFDGGHRWHGDVAFPLLDQVLKPTG